MHSLFHRGVICVKINVNQSCLPNIVLRLQVLDVLTVCELQRV